VSGRVWPFHLTAYLPLPGTINQAVALEEAMTPDGVTGISISQDREGAHDSLAQLRLEVLGVSHEPNATWTALPDQVARLLGAPQPALMQLLLAFERVAQRPWGGSGVRAAWMEFEDPADYYRLLRQLHEGIWHMLQGQWPLEHVMPDYRSLWNAVGMRAHVPARLRRANLAAIDTVMRETP
jgi:hypothetical protein